MKLPVVVFFTLLAITPTVFSQVVQDNSSIVKAEESVEELIKLSNEARAQGRFEEALSILKKAEQLQPQNLDVQFYIGLTQYNLADIIGSEITLRAVLKAEPKYVDAKIILGRVLLAKGDFNESERLLREAILQTPDYIDAYDALASNLAAQKKFIQAVFVLDQGLARAPKDVQLLVKKGKILFYDKQLDASLVVAEKLIGSSDEGAKYQGYLLKAKIVFDKNPTKIGLASSLLFNAIDISHGDSEAHIVLADIYASVWKFKQAEDVLNDALARVNDRSRIEVKIEDIKALAIDVDRFQMATSVSSWKFDDQRPGWQEYYLDGVWRIDPYKTLVLGVEQFTRDDLSDQTLRVEYSQKLNKWIYAYAAGRMTVDSDFREKNGLKVGTNFVTNPLPVGSSVFTTEAETRLYDTGRVYFLTGGVEQYIGKSFIVNAKIFRVLTDGKDFNVWSTKVTWNVTDKFSVNGGYGTMTEDVRGNLAHGHSYNLGAQYRVNNRFSVVGNYTRHSNELYKADQYTVGIKINFGPRKK
jgi:YaiO family outer membrane protein